MFGATFTLGGVNNSEGLDALPRWIRGGLERGLLKFANLDFCPIEWSSTTC